MHDLPFNPVADFSAISAMDVAPMILFAHPRLPAATAASSDLIRDDLARWDEIVRAAQIRIE